jgi:DNA-binding GntR family transcriptional regulator
METGASKVERGKDKVYEVLRQRVVGGRYKPGTQLKEEPLARELGVSRTPVRTALRRLVEEGLATADAGQGIHVAAWSEWDIEETFQLRMLLEPYAASLAAERGDEEMLKILKDSNERMATAIRDGGPHSVEKIQAANSTFHRTILIIPLRRACVRCWRPSSTCPSSSVPSTSMNRHNWSKACITIRTWSWQWKQRW